MIEKRIEYIEANFILHIVFQCIMNGTRIYLYINYILNFRFFFNF